MIGYLAGKILEKEKSRIVMGVGTAEAGMVGYVVGVPQGERYEALKVGLPARFHVYTHIREDAMDLFGFLEREEKELFLLLIQVSGIGPKAALSLLSATSTDLLISAILGGDKDFLVAMPGIGKKTAERLIVELADPVQKKFGDRHRGGSPLGAKGSQAGQGGDRSLASDAYSEAKAALLGLGYREADAARVLDRVWKESVEAGRMPRVEEIVRSALQRTTQ